MSSSCYNIKDFEKFYNLIISYGGRRNNYGKGKIRYL